MASELAIGRWSLQSSENFDAWMKTVGVSMPTRMIVSKLKPDQEISLKDGSWTIKTLSTFKNSEATFKMDEAFRTKTPDGRDVEVLWTMDGNKFFKKETGEFDTHTTYDFSKDQFTLTLESKGVVCTRVYQRVQQ